MTTRISLPVDDVSNPTIVLSMLMVSFIGMIVCGSEPVLVFRFSLLYLIRLGIIDLLFALIKKTNRKLLEVDLLLNKVNH